jgi:hypothetical protein
VTAVAGLIADREGTELPADHPFLGFGSCRSFEAGSEGSSVRLAAAIDRRQVEARRQVGTIGFIEAASHGESSARALAAALGPALDWLRSEGAALVRCPVQLSTWYGHRAVVDGFAEEGGAAPFFLEPHNRRWLPDALAAAGFSPRLEAVSHLVPNTRAVAANQAAQERALATGYRDRPLRLETLESELDLLHGLSSTIFSAAWGNSPMSSEEFGYLYRPLVAAVDPELVRIIEAPTGEPVGFVFAVPDHLGPPAGRPGARFVLKTIGVLPAARRAFPGLGSALVARVHGLADARGYASGIHAQMSVGSYAQRASARWGGGVMRRYATFEREP